MIKSLYRKIRVVHCTEGRKFIVQTRNWWFAWKTMQEWSYADNSKIGFGAVISEEQARTAAITYAQKLFEQVVIWEKSNFHYF